MVSGMMYSFRLPDEDDKELMWEHQNEPEKLKRLGREGRKFTRQEFDDGFEVKRGRSFIYRWFQSDHNAPQIGFVTVGGILLTDRLDGYLGIPWSLFPEYRGKGIGRTMVKEAVHAFPGPKLAKIEHHNIPSIRCAEYAGYKIKEITEKYVVMIWEP